MITYLVMNVIMSTLIKTKTISEDSSNQRKVLWLITNVQNCKSMQCENRYTNRICATFWGQNYLVKLNLFDKEFILTG